MQKTCGRMIVDFSTDMGAAELMEHFNDFLLKTADIKLLNMNNLEVVLIADCCEVITLYDNKDEEVVAVV